MLLPDNIYRRIPLIWMIMGVLFLVLAALAGSDLPRVAAYLAIGFVGIGRSFWLYQARRRIARHGEVASLTETQKMTRRTE